MADRAERLTTRHVKRRWAVGEDATSSGFLYLGSVEEGGQASERARPRRPGHALDPADLSGAALPADERPLDPTPVHTADLPPTPTRDRSIPVEAWIEAP